jgi:hypothetical protein
MVEISSDTCLSVAADVVVGIVILGKYYVLAVEPLRQDREGTGHQSEKFHRCVEEGAEEALEEELSSWSPCPLPTFLPSFLSRKGRADSSPTTAIARARGFALENFPAHADLPELATRSVSVFFLFHSITRDRRGRLLFRVFGNAGARVNIFAGTVAYDPSSPLKATSAL